MRKTELFSLYQGLGAWVPGETLINQADWPKAGKCFRAGFLKEEGKAAAVLIVWVGEAGNFSGFSVRAEEGEKAHQCFFYIIKAIKYVLF